MCKLQLPTFLKLWVSVATRVAEVDNLDHIAKVHAVVVRAKRFSHEVKTSSMIFATTGGISIHITHGSLYVLRRKKPFTFTVDTVLAMTTLHLAKWGKMLLQSMILMLGRRLWKSSRCTVIAVHTERC